ncbi:hypothetical protein [Bacillus cereus]|uniref:hypothetical protein n=1 Tax=Bacillus cereus TaxID=1396 RepID=UPI000BF85026|nr:hypothetical protein [Bacillus cereus]PFI23089.1 hypothetical protein COI75_14450 [Bacillus cereus]
MNRFNKCNHIPFPCAFPIPSEGATGPVLQPFVNGNIDGQTIASGGAVVFPLPADTFHLRVTGITYNGTDTFTIIESGLYFIDVTLNYAPGTPVNSTFTVSINGAIGVSPATNADTVGPISVIRVGNYSAGDTVRIINDSPNPVIIANGNSTVGPTLFTAGHITFFRFADGPQP